MEQYAYIRVSTKEQHIDRQIMALKPYSISPKILYLICDYPHKHYTFKHFEV